MNMTVFIHVLAGSLALISGYIALYSTKGAPLHRRAGRVFVSAMIPMTIFGGWMAIAGANEWTSVNVSAATVTLYLVVTSLTTVRPFTRGGRWLHVLGLVVASTVSVVDFTFAFEAISNGGKRNGVPAFPFVMFGVAALLGSIGDLRILRSGPLAGARRLTRHLWRMTFALLVAAMSFFLGQADEIPEPIRIMPLLALPVVAVLVTLLYWMWRVRRKRAVRSMVIQAEPMPQHS